MEKSISIFDDNYDQKNITNNEAYIIIRNIEYQLLRIIQYEYSNSNKDLKSFLNINILLFTKDNDDGKLRRVIMKIKKIIQNNREYSKNFNITSKIIGVVNTIINSTNLEQVDDKLINQLTNLTFQAKIAIYELFINKKTSNFLKKSRVLRNEICHNFEEINTDELNELLKYIKDEKYKELFIEIINKN